MTRGGAHFKSEELVRVLSYYDIGIIQKATSLSAGNKHAPKVVVTAEKGKFLLKRRPKAKNDLYRVSFAHSVQNYLAQQSFPVAPLVQTKEGNTFLQLNSHIYELYKFISGKQTVDAGRELAELHKHLSNFTGEFKPLKGVFHDSSTVRRHLKLIGSEKNNGGNGKMQDIADMLIVHYNASSIRVNELGYDSWAEQVVHGDWHPGNILFSKGKVVAILDLDSVRFATATADLANGLLQFSIVGGRPNPADWPDYFDQAKIAQLLDGYTEIIKLDKDKIDALVDLMIETMIAEAVLPIAATGFFGHLSGVDFLKMIKRKTEWLDENRKKLKKAMTS